MDTVNNNTYLGTAAGHIAASISVHTMNRVTNIRTPNFPFYS